MNWRKRKAAAAAAAAQDPQSLPEFRYPDFICIGAQKAGTSWLDRNLRRHPKLWLPPMKELQFFSHLYIPQARNWTTRQRQEKGSKLLKRYLDKNAQEDWDYRRIARLADIVGGPITDDWYGRMFALAPADSVCGEVTPDYSTLPPEGIEHVLRLSPNVRIIFSLRDPIARSWSHIRMTAQARDITDVAVLERFASQDNQVHRANYPAIIESWRRHIPEDRFLVVFLDDIQAAPGAVLERLCGFLKVPYEEGFFPNAANPAHVGQEMEMPSSVLEILRDRFRPIYDDIAMLYPEYGAAWRARYY
ncbi:MAG TPA: sulfotransferase [Rhizomicrobium sp.]|nr:sulfotransferase [Rhizomicrobium sp.]